MLIEIPDEQFREDEDQQLAMAETFKTEDILEDPEYYIAKKFQFFVGFEHRTIAIKEPMFIGVNYSNTHYGVKPITYEVLPAVAKLILWTDRLEKEIQNACINNFQSLGHKINL